MADGPVKSVGGAPPRIRRATATQALTLAQQRAREQPQPMTRLIGLALADLMAQYDNMVLCGEDVGRKGASTG
jgi:2-oxoisovalerate dehydrogenase E1 component